MHYDWAISMKKPCKKFSPCKISSSELLEILLSPNALVSCVGSCMAVWTVGMFEDGRNPALNKHVILT